MYSKCQWIATLSNVGICTRELVSGMMTAWLPTPSVAHSLQVVVERTKPNGRVIGIDIIPAQPPKGVSTIQGNFLSPGVQQLVKDYLAEFAKPRDPPVPILEPSKEGEIMVTERQSYIDAERAESVESEHLENDGRLVDVCILSQKLRPEDADYLAGGSKRHVRPLGTIEWTL